VDEAGPQNPRKEKEHGKDDQLSDLVAVGSRRDSQRPPYSRENSVTSLTSRSESPQPQTRRRSSGGVKRHAVTPLSTIPNVYFEENFQLENPRTFDIVSERSEIIRPAQPSSKDDEKNPNGHANGAPRKALATNAILQEKLSWYMDTVEIHLISSISSASASFFAALGSLRHLQAEAADSVAKIQKLRQDLTSLDRELAMGGLEIVSRKRRRENLRKLAEAAEQLQYVVDGAAYCEDLVDGGDFDAAMDSIECVDKLVFGTLNVANNPDAAWLVPNPSLKLIDLRRLRALEGISDGMAQLRRRIGKGFESRFLEVLLSDLRQHISDVPAKDTLQRWSSAAQRSRGDSNRASLTVPAYLKTPESLRAELLSVLRGLSRSRQTMPATTAFREAVMREMKTLIRRHLPSSNDDDAASVTSNATRGSRGTSQGDKSAILARNLRALEPDAAEELLVSIYTDIGEALRRLGVQIKVLLDVTSGISSPGPGVRSPPRSPRPVNMDGYLNRTSSAGNLQEELSQALDMSSLLGQAVDVAQTQITKILKVRTEQSVRLPFERFLRYFILNKLFADECEAVSGRSGAAFKGLVNQQITDFVGVLVDAEKQQLAEIMESDRWEAKDFGEREEVVLRRVMEGMTRDPPAWFKHTAVWEELEEEQPLVPNTEANGTKVEKEKEKEKTRPALVDEEKYILVDCTLAALRGVDRFESLIAVIPAVSSELSSALLDYLKLFNSRSCQLILGAGATRSAGLKNINTKHLALASQSLSFFISLLPYIREFVRRRPSVTGNSLAEYDKVRRLFQDHQVSIHEKLIEIMSNRATVHAATMSRIDWDNEATTSQNLSPHMEVLARETSTLHRVLGRHLPEPTVGMIMGPVFRSYREQWGKAFTDAVVRSEAGKERYVDDRIHVEKPTTRQ